MRAWATRAEIVTPVCRARSRTRSASEAGSLTVKTTRAAVPTGIVPRLTTIVASGGRILAGPLEEKEGILYAEVDIDLISLERRQFDPVGHYSRPDVFRLSVDTTARSSVVFDSDGPDSLGTNRA